MNEETKQEVLAELVKTNQWDYVEEIIKEEIARLQSIETLDAQTDAQALQIEIRSRQLAKHTLEKIINAVRAYADGEKTTPMNRSYR